MRSGQRWRTNYCCYVAEEFFVAVLTLMAVLAGISGRTLSRRVSSPDEISRPREITLPGEMWRQCQPVLHDVLWLRLNVAPRLASNTDNLVASGPQIERRPSHSTVVQSPEVDADFRSERRRRDTRRRRRQKDRRRRRQNRRRSNRRRHLAEELLSTEPWHCHVTWHWLRMPDDVFPPYIQTGNCTQSRCMMGLYECRPRKYAVRIFRRLPSRCNPLPVTGDVTAGAGFEEAWSAEEYHVIVGCECSRRRTSGLYDD